MELQKPIGNAVLIAGPTASGKSALALRIAREVGGVVVNADSMQVYSTLRALTARPTEEEQAGIPHLLYGYINPALPYSVGAYLRDVEQLKLAGEFAHRRPVFVGGTGLYFRALLQGLSAMPDVPVPVREKWRGRLAAEGAPSLHVELSRLDPQAGANLRPSDGQRIVRALEVLEASGRSILDWQGARGEPLVDPATAMQLVLEPPRDVLHDRIARRLPRMIAEGALDEVKALLALGLPLAMPAMKAIGVRELADVIEGRSDLIEAQRCMEAATRQYAKRQSTWFRTQCGPEWQRLSEADLPLGDLPGRFTHRLD